MKASTVLLTALLHVVVAVYLDDVVSTSPSPSRRAVVTSNNNFARAVFEALSTQPGNIVLSPVSAHSVLTMAWLGAGGHTAREMLTGLRLPDNRSVVEEGFTQLMDSLQSTDTVTLDVANKMYLDEHFAVKEDYRQKVVDIFRSDVQKVNFVTNSEGARNTINQWVQGKTHDKIKDLIAEDTLSTDTVMVMVNAIYFKGGWLKPFEENATQMETFHVSADGGVSVPMMYASDYFYFQDVDALNATALKLRYRGESLSMVIVLPHEVDGLPHVEQSMMSSDVCFLCDWTKTRVDVYLPKFKVEATLKLHETLEELGIRSVFQRGANLTGITDQAVHINKVIQKAFVEVTEKGTEAAAATYYEAISKSLMYPRTFRADHPFLFFIVDESINVVLFMGRLANPV